MQVRSAMLDHPLTTTPEETFGSLLERMLPCRQATAAVLDAGGRLVGLVGVHDVLRKIVPLYVDLDSRLMEVMHESYFEERLAHLKDTKVTDFMTPVSAVDSVAPDDTLMKAVVIIVENRRKTLPVLDHGKYVGMITRRSILDKIGQLLLGHGGG